MKNFLERGRRFLTPSNGCRFSSNYTRKQPAVLSDSFGRFHNYLRISVTERCNLRCTYCMPEQGIDLTPNDDLMSIEETKRIVSIFTSLGVNKIRYIYTTHTNLLYL